MSFKIIKPSQWQIDDDYSIFIQSNFQIYKGTRYVFDVNPANYPRYEVDPLTLQTASQQPNGIPIPFKVDILTDYRAQLISDAVTFNNSIDPTSQKQYLVIEHEDEPTFQSAPDPQLVNIQIHTANVPQHGGGGGGGGGPTPIRPTPTNPSPKPGTNPTPAPSSQSAKFPWLVVLIGAGVLILLVVLLLFVL